MKVRWVVYLVYIAGSIGLLLFLLEMYNAGSLFEMNTLVKFVVMVVMLGIAFGALSNKRLKCKYDEHI